MESKCCTADTQDIRWEDWSKTEKVNRKESLHSKSDESRQDKWSHFNGVDTDVEMKPHKRRTTVKHSITNRNGLLSLIVVLVI